MSSTRMLGSYTPYFGQGKVTYTYESTVAGWVVCEEKEGQEKTIGIPSKIIRELLEQVEQMKVRAWEEAMGEDL